MMMMSTTMISNTYLIMTISVIVGQTLRAWLWRSPKIWPIAFCLSWSLKDTGTNTDQSATYEFLLVIHSNYGPYLVPFPRWRAIFAKVSHPLVFKAPLGTL